ncbi:MAG TPA: carbamoyltransferase C-terminal domain-containing protein [Pyrinomonadaceae bacterium]|nr:carbamoyltransferase C-terminal domain-containing protein [Pyrinomonadaceae bacterium]
MASQQAKDKANWIIGISASHNGAVCLLRDDQLVVAVQEERLTRVKRHRIYGAEPSRSLAYCLSYAGITADDVSLAVVCLQGRAQDAHQVVAANPALQRSRGRIPTIVIPHHLGHAFSAFAASGFEEAAVLVIDGAGSPFEDLPADERDVVTERLEDGWETVSLYSAAGTSIIPLEKHLVARGGWYRPRGGGMPRFGSLGGMFSAVATQLFADPMEAGKVMGLAPYGTPTLPPGAFFEIGDKGFNFREDVPAMFAHEERWPARSAEYMNLAASVQSALETAVLHLARRLRELCPSDNLCYAGGVALNSVANERLIREAGFRAVHIPPAAEDSGPAIGAAYYGLWKLTGHNTRRRMAHDACGKTYTQADISTAVEKFSQVRTLKPANLVAEAVERLCAGQIIGWFDGGSELGPRALGQRSILCDPRRPDAKEILNLRVKRREPFRPFAPVVPLEQVDDWFELDGAPRESPFMLRVCEFKKAQAMRVPAVVHVDGTGRVQTVTREANGRFYELVKSFGEATGVPVVLNTSFNVMGEPIVETPEDAVACLLKSGLDCCVFPDRIVVKN